MNEAATGLAAEYIVLTDLLLSGYTAHRVDNPDSPFDLVLSTPTRLLRIQVKSTQYPKINATRSPKHKYSFSIHTKYKNNTDIFAFVALDTRTILYEPTAEVFRNAGAGPGSQYKYYAPDDFSQKAPGSRERAFSFCLVD